jgi:hypothetical protein
MAGVGNGTRFFLNFQSNWSRKHFFHCNCYTEDTADYIPPKGVKGEYDPINDIQSKEQSLVLKFSNLEGGYKAAAKKTLYTIVVIVT